MIEKLTKPEVQDFINRHQHDDPVMLMLQSKKYPHLPFKAVVQQIQSRQKARQKLPEWFATKGILFPPPLSLEQCSSEITAKYKAGLLSGKAMADLTGGGGVDAYYLHRSFEKVDYVEQSPLLCEVARHNFRLFSAAITVHNETAAEYLASLKCVDLLYLDPARRDPEDKKVFLLQDCEPNVVALQHDLLQKANVVMVKTSPILDIQLAINAFGHVKEVHIVAVNNEVKEVLYVLEATWNASPRIMAVNLDKVSGVVTQAFLFTQAEEATATVNYAMPQRYLYEPNKAILKAGAFKCISQRFQLAKLHPHSHLYTSDKLIAFPGRIFERIATVPYHRKALLPYLPGKKANITTRNFPDSVQAIRKKTGIKEGGEVFLMATTNMEEKLTMVVCRKVKLHDLKEFP